MRYLEKRMEWPGSIFHLTGMIDSRNFLQRNYSSMRPKPKANYHKNKPSMVAIFVASISTPHSPRHK
jgi:hypothetical protein